MHSTRTPPAPPRHSARTPASTIRRAPCAAGQCRPLVVVAIAHTWATRLRRFDADRGLVAPRSAAFGRPDRPTRADESSAHGQAVVPRAHTVRPPAAPRPRSIPPSLCRGPRESTLESTQSVRRCPVPSSPAPAPSRRAFLFAESDVLFAPWVVTSSWIEPFLARNTHSYTGSPPEFQLTLALTRSDSRLYPRPVRAGISTLTRIAPSHSTMEIRATSLAVTGMTGARSHFGAFHSIAS